MIFILTSLSIKGHNIVMLIKIQKSELDETQSLYFPIEATTLWLVFLLIIAIINLNKLYYFVLYLVNLLLNYSTIFSTIFCGFDIRSKEQIITSNNRITIKSHHYTYENRVRWWNVICSICYLLNRLTLKIVE